MPTNLAGSDLVVTFPATTGTDARPPYTNTGGANQAATLTLQTVSASSAITEPGAAIQETAKAIALVVKGPGRIILAGGNTYSGGTTIDGSRLVAKVWGSVGSGAVSVVNGGSLILNGGRSGVTMQNPLTLNGMGVGNNGALQSVFKERGSGTTYVLDVVLGSSSRINTDVGFMRVSGVVSGAGRDLFAGGTGDTIYEGHIATGSGGLTKDGAGTVILSGTNSYTGLTTIKEGVLVVGSGAAIADTSAVVIQAQGALSLTSLETVGSVSGSGSIILGGGTLTTGGDGTSKTYAGVIHDFTEDFTGGLTKIGAGKLTLSGANTYSGDTTISGGTLALTGNGSLANSSVVVGADTIFDVSRVDGETSVRDLSGAGVSSTVKVGDRALFITGATDETFVHYIGATGAASDLFIDMASANFTLATATFSNWTSGEDTISISGTNGHNEITGSSEDDIIDGRRGGDKMRGGRGNDTYFVDHRNDRVIETGAGTDLVYSTVSFTLGARIENLILDGGDAIDGTGNALDNGIFGNGSANVIEGGGGTDGLLGGDGADTFVYHADFGFDTIGDFTEGSGVDHDTIQIDSSLFADYADLLAHTMDTADGAVITFDADNTITLTDVTKASLTSDNFAFV